MNSMLSKDIEVAGDNILKLVSKIIKVNTFCITNIKDSESYFINVFNRKVNLAEAGTILPVYDAY